MRWGLGFTLDHEDFRMPSPTSFSWGGRGGSFAVMDPATGVSCAYVMNDHLEGTFKEEPRKVAFWSALREVLAKL